MSFKKKIVKEWVPKKKDLFNQMPLDVIATILAFALNPKLAIVCKNFKNAISTHTYHKIRSSYLLKLATNINNYIPLNNRSDIFKTANVYNRMLLMFPLGLKVDRVYKTAEDCSIIARIVKDKEKLYIKPYRDINIQDSDFKGVFVLRQAFETVF